ncbi:MAG: S-adenosylmethionine decarboxylase, partial [Ktedonobacteraceae bacterium]
DYTLVQLLEDTHVVGHFITARNIACLNVVSCSAFAPVLCAAFCQHWFEAQDVRLSVILRGPEQQVSPLVADISVQEKGW